MELFTIGIVICLLSGIGCYCLLFNCIDWFEKIKEVEIMYTALFIIGLIAFAYLMYVLVKPEKF